MHQIALALKYIRDNNIVYHKLIPQNLFIKKGLFIKIIDFSNAMSN
jgi:serine/threonine protein kinase